MVVGEHERHGRDPVRELVSRKRQADGKDRLWRLPHRGGKGEAVDGGMEEEAQRAMHGEGSVLVVLRGTNGVHRMSVGVEHVQLVQKQGQQERPQHDQQGDVHVLADGFGAFGI
jgi:hypothetical protein